MDKISKYWDSQNKATYLKIASHIISEFQTVLKEYYKERYSTEHLIRLIKFSIDYLQENLKGKYAKWTLAAIKGKIFNDIITDFCSLSLDTRTNKEINRSTPEPDTGIDLPAQIAAQATAKLLEDDALAKKTFDSQTPEEIKSGRDAYQTMYGGEGAPTSLSRMGFMMKAKEIKDSGQFSDADNEWYNKFSSYLKDQDTNLHLEAIWDSFVAKNGDPHLNLFELLSGKKKDVKDKIEKVKSSEKGKKGDSDMGDNGKGSKGPGEGLW